MSARTFSFGEPLTVAACVERAAVPAIIAGDPARLVSNVSNPESAGPESVCFCAATGEDGLTRLRDCRAAAVIVHEELALERGDTRARTVVRTKEPMLLFARLLAASFPDREAGVSPQASIHPSARLGKGIAIGSFSVIERDCVVDEDTTIGPGACLRRGCVVGRNVRVEPNVVIGGEGLAYARDTQGRFEFLPHLGRAVIGNDVVVGAGSTVMRGILQDTSVGDGTKLGNLVNVGHNAVIGRDCFVSSGVTICGSAVLEDGCWIAAGAVVLNHVRVGAGAKITLGAVVTRDIAPGAVVAGNPARPVSPGVR